MEALVRRHADGVFRFAFRRLGNREDAEEVANDVFFALLRPRSQAAPVPTHFKPWLFGIARHRVADRLRSRYRTVGRQVPVDETVEQVATASIEDELRIEEPGLWITSMLAVLSAREREVVELLLAGLTTKEIAATLEITPASTYVALSRAMRRLRNSLAEQEEYVEGEQS
jgi:RNA polymerase sigma-70 factor (ECF subfamily)